MKRFILPAVLLLVSWGGLLQAAEPPPAQVVQIFACNLAEGQTGDNVWALMDALRANNEAQARGPESGLFVWVPYRGPAEYDFVLGVMSKDLNTMAADSLAYANSPGAAAIGQRFQTLESCVSGIVMSEQISDGPISMTGGDRVADAVVETFSCKLNEGADMDDVDSAVKFWQGQVEKINSSALNDYLAYLWTPFRGNTGASDFVWVGNAADLTAWAQGASDYASSAAGQAADERFAAITTCSNQMWMGYWVVAPSNF